MNSFYETNAKRPPRFRPPLIGCVARDRQLAIALGGCYTDSFLTIGAQIWRSLSCESEDRRLSDLFDRMATEALEQFRTLGELIAALGGDGMVRLGKCGTRGGSTRERNGAEMIAAAIGEKRCCVDRYETLMSRTGDRVVRSVLSRLIFAERKMISELEGFACEKTCE